MKEDDVREVMKKIIEMMNVISDLDENTGDAEMSKYFLGFREALDWVQTDVLRDDRIKHHIVLQMDDK